MQSIFECNFVIRENAIEVKLSLPGYYIE